MWRLRDRDILACGSVGCSRYPSYTLKSEASLVLDCELEALLEERLAFASGGIIFASKSLLSCLFTWAFSNSMLFPGLL